MMQESPIYTPMEIKVSQFARRALTGLAVIGLCFSAAACNKGNSGRSSIERPDDMAIGNPNAPVTIIEYASLTCPHCGDFEEEVFKPLRKEYVDTGKVRFIYRQFPTPPARLAIGAEAVARCKGDSKDYFELLDVLYDKQRSWVLSDNPGQALRDIAATAGITPAQFDKCVSDPEVTKRIDEVVQHAVKTWGLNSTPQFIINGQHYENLHSLEGFQKVLDPMLGIKEPEAKPDASADAKPAAKPADQPETKSAAQPDAKPAEAAKTGDAG